MHRSTPLFTLLTILGTALVFGQVDTGTISGTVKDSSGAVVPGTSVVILNQGTGISRTVEADSSGHYAASSLGLGDYRITGTHAGFQTMVRSGIVLTVGQEAVVDLSLSVGAVTQTVEVTGEAQQIDTTSATISGLVAETQVRDLPLNGRSLTDLTLLSPGVFYNRTAGSDQATGFGPRLSIAGGRADANLFLLDGMVTNDRTGGTATTAGLSLGVESIREFRVLTHNFSAEYGRSAGGVVSMVTRSGTNQFHGSVYEFVRNDIFDARDFFNPGSLPPFRRNQFGGAAGGRIVKDRLFFFANYEGMRQRQGVTFTSTVPDANARKGLLPDPNNPGQLLAVPFSPLIAPYLNNFDLWPLPNGRVFGDGTGQWIKDLSQPATDDYAMERMDFVVSAKDNAYWRYVYNPSDKIVSGSMPNFGSHYVASNHFATVSETHIFSPTALNDFRVSFARTIRGQDSEALFNLDPSFSFLPGIGFGNIKFSTTSSGNGGGTLSRLGNAGSHNNNLLQNLFETTETFTWIHGSHSWKFGVDIQRAQLNSNNDNLIRGEWTFGSLQNLLAAQPSTVDGVVNTNVSRDRGYRETLFSWFIQDDYRINGRLTLNLGLRHEFWTDPNEINGYGGNLRNITDTGPTLGPSAKLAKLNFAPRVGLAWDPTGRGKTSVRLGAGIYHNQVVGTPNSDSPFLSSYLVSFAANSPTGFPLLPTNPPLSSKTEATSSWPLATPTVINYTLNVQQQLTRTISVSLGYVGSYGYNMTRVSEQDLRIARIQPNGLPIFDSTAAFVNPNYSEITLLSADTVYNHNGLQATMQKALSAGLMFAASYSFGKTLSQADSTANQTIQNGGSFTSMWAANPDLDYGRSSYDQRHTFSFNSLYQMPWDHRLNSALSKAVLGGWSVNGIWQYGSGMPLDMGLGFANSRSGSSQQADRPDLLPGFSNNPTSGVTAGCGAVGASGQTLIPAGQQLHTPTRWFDPCAFGLSPAGTFGNLGRNTVSGPDYNSTNFTLEKTTRIMEGKNLVFRAEIFNLFNHPSFGLPQIALFTSARVHAGNEGVISTTTSQGRQIQLGMKFVF